MLVSTSTVNISLHRAIHESNVNTQSQSRKVVPPPFSGCCSRQLNLTLLSCQLFSALNGRLLRRTLQWPSLQQLPLGLSHTHSFGTYHAMLPLHRHHQGVEHFRSEICCCNKRRGLPRACTRRRHCCTLGRHCHTCPGSRVCRLRPWGCMPGNHAAHSCMCHRTSPRLLEVQHAPRRPSSPRNHQGSRRLARRKHRWSAGAATAGSTPCEACNQHGCGSLAPLAKQWPRNH